jgi:ketosteroid isomerase-like protein
MTRRGEEMVREVFRRVRNADARVAELYCPDAALHERGNVHRGRPAIREFYENVFRMHGSQPVVRGVWAAESLHSALLEVVRADGSVAHAIDLFDVCDSGIRSMRTLLGALDRGWTPKEATFPGPAGGAA